MQLRLLFGENAISEMLENEREVSQLENLSSIILDAEFDVLFSELDDPIDRKAIQEDVAENVLFKIFKP